MSLYIAVDEWSSTVEQDYLTDFVRRGGAAVKFAVAETAATRRALSDGLQHAAQGQGYQFVALDAARTRLHLIDKVFHEVARHIAWDELARGYTAQILGGLGYATPLDPSDLTLRPRVERKFQDELLHHYGMTQEFRIAMLWLCMAHMYPEEPNLSIATAVQEWLRGELRLVSALRRAALFQKIGRHNARHMLASQPPWLRACGKAGLVLTLDITRFLEPRPRGERDDTIYYSAGAVMDGYEVLRQCVDGTDEMEHCLTVVMAPPTLLAPDEPRGLSLCYEALKLRVLDEVHDRQRANPLAPLVRVH